MGLSGDQKCGTSNTNTGIFFFSKEQAYPNASMESFTLTPQIWISFSMTIQKIRSNADILPQMLPQLAKRPNFSKLIRMMNVAIGQSWACCNIEESAVKRRLQRRWWMYGKISLSSSQDCNASRSKITFVFCSSVRTTLRPQAVGWSMYRRTYDTNWQATF